MNSISGRFAALTLAAVMASPALAAGQETPTAPSTAITSTTAQPTVAASVLPAGTVVEIALLKPVGSKLSKRGDRFGIRLAEDLRRDGVVVLRAGVEGEGEVIHASPGKMGGGPGELLLAARFLDRDGVRVPLKALKMGRAGADNVETAMVVGMIAGPFALFVQGGEVTIPAGTIANAKLAADLPVLPPTPVASDTQTKS
jgi:hypothetical protein